MRPEAASPKCARAVRRQVAGGGGAGGAGGGQGEVGALEGGFEVGKQVAGGTGGGGCNTPHHQFSIAGGYWKPCTAEGPGESR